MATDVRLAGPDDVDAVGASLARAFADDPVFRYLYPALDDEQRSSKLLPFFAATARTRLKLAAVWTNPERTGAALWVPPGQHVSEFQDRRAGYAYLRLAWRSTPRALRVLGAMKKAHPKDPAHWYLAVLGTDPDHQGRGVGSALLTPVLDRCDAEGVPAYLESSKESNVPYYERFGFRVMRELSCGDGAPSMWPMWRDPR